ncbi:hypothetical protein [Nocardia sp. CNY236]|uniref:hypothetical protein n=1 Tax=Nocardia sp. CNY236 TaxID=1169152 RepID=UPI0012DF3368|nr:hypothetical protein [Nocardia sp. CNY236]
MENTIELAQELAGAARRHGCAIAGIVGSAARKVSWEVLDFVAESRDLMGAAWQAAAADLHCRSRSRDGDDQASGCDPVADRSATSVRA